MKKAQNSGTKISKKWCLPGHKQKNRARLVKSRKENPKNKNLEAQGRGIPTSALEQLVFGTGAAITQRH